MKLHVLPSELQGEVTLPASKSDAQRALLAACLANGTSTIVGIGESDDVLMMQQAINQLGAQLTGNSQRCFVSGMAPVAQNKSLFIGESGLGARLLIAVASVFKLPVFINGKGSLLKRSMSFYDEVLPQLGAQIQSNKGCLPVTVCGPITGGELIVNGIESSQTISGLLCALPLCLEDSLLTVVNMTSQPYVNMTLHTLSSFGIKIEQINSATFRIPGRQVYRAATYYVESDWSAASYWLVAAALGHAIAVKGLTNDSLQADRAILQVFSIANITYSFENEALQVNGEMRRRFEFDATNCPDLFPALVVLALNCVGTSVIRGTNRLKQKESDRAAVLVSEFTKLGGVLRVDNDCMYIAGITLLHGGKVSAHNDHRIAMALAIAATRASASVEIDQAESVAKSYPSFWDELKYLTIQKEE